ncbi:Rho GTPase-activating protein 44, partial [Fragariocoptes setiger]
LIVDYRELIEARHVPRTASNNYSLLSTATIGRLKLPIPGSIEGNKNDCIGEDLIAVERTFDDIRQVCVYAQKKISSYLQSTSSSAPSSSSYHSSTSSLTGQQQHQLEHLHTDKQSSHNNRGQPLNNLDHQQHPINHRLKVKNHTSHEGIEDKRFRKLPVVSFNRFLQKSSDHLRPDSLLGLTFDQCSRLQSQLGSHFINYENQIEQQCLKPLQHMLESDIPNVLKCRKLFVKASQELENARSRFTGASNKQQQQQQQQQQQHHHHLGHLNPSVSSAASQQLTGANATLVAQQQVSATNKLEQLKKELDDASARADQAKDNYITELFGFIAREPEIVGIFAKFYEFQAEHHKNAFRAIQASMPSINCLLEDTPRRPVFGTPLMEHLRVTQREISIVIEVCTELLIRNGLDEEGLFRVSGSASKVKKFKHAIDAWFVSLANDHERLGQGSARHFITQVLARYDDDQLMRDSHTIAGVLKLHLRELPEPLLTYTLHDRWLEAVRQPTRDSARLKSLAAVCSALPKGHYDNLRYLIKLLALITSRSGVNKMSSSNLAIAIAPSLIWDRPAVAVDSDNSSITSASDSIKGSSSNAQLGTIINTMTMSSVNMSTSLHALIVDTLINNVDQFFPPQTTASSSMQSLSQQTTASGSLVGGSGGRPSATPSPSSLSALSTCTTSSKASGVSLGSGCSVISSSLTPSSNSSSSSSLTAPVGSTITRRPTVPPPDRPASNESPELLHRSASSERRRPPRPPPISTASIDNTRPTQGELIGQNVHVHSASDQQSVHANNDHNDYSLNAIVDKASVESAALSDGGASLSSADDASSW